MLPADLHLGPTRLAVSDLDSALRWYRRVLGLTPRSRDADVAYLASEDGPVVIELMHDPDARSSGRHAGLYHLALLHPDRAELSRSLRRLRTSRVEIADSTDHGTHEAFYISDPDGIGLELAADRPREEWPWKGSDPWGDGPQAVDVDDLLALTADEPEVPPVARGIVTGHVHLHVSNVERGRRFYEEVLGFEHVVRRPNAAFSAAGGYHHHVGYNTQRGTDVPPQPADAVGLRWWTIALDAEAIEGVVARAEAADVPVTRLADAVELRDPWNLAVRLVTED